MNVESLQLCFRNLKLYKSTIDNNQLSDGS